MSQEYSVCYVIQYDGLTRGEHEIDLAELAQDFTKSRTIRLSRCQERLVPFLAIHAQESEPP